MAQVKADNVPLLAAGLAYYAVLALFPAVIAAVTLYGLVADPAEIERQVSSFLTGLPEAGEIIQNQIRAATSSQRGLSIGALVSLLLALYSASAGANGIVRGINVVYDEEETRGFLKLRGLSLLLTVGALVTGLIAIGLVGVLPAVIDSFGLGRIGETVVRVVRWPALALLAVAGLGLLYRYAPNRQAAKVRWVTWGAITATALWLIGSGLFSLYISNFSNYGATYGTVAGIIILLLWLFLSSFALLLGAEINAEMERQTRRDSTTGPEQPLGSRGARAADTVGKSAS